MYIINQDKIKLRQKVVAYKNNRKCQTSPTYLLLLSRICAEHVATKLFVYLSPELQEKAMGKVVMIEVGVGQELGACGPVRCIQSQALLGGRDQQGLKQAKLETIYMSGGAQPSSGKLEKDFYDSNLPQTLMCLP